MTITGEGRRPDASMTLLTSMLERPLDPGYAAAAQARQARGLPSQTSLRSPLVIAFAVTLGLVLGLASAALRGQDSTRAKARAALVAQIEQRRTTLDTQTRRIAELQAQIVALDEASLKGTDAGRAGELQRASVLAGAVAVQGPAFVVTLDDSAAAKARLAEGGTRTTVGEPDYVLARDIQIVTNALWEAGAEAVAVNGQRLTTTSAIRFAGEAILVDFRPLTSPYVVTAIGDPKKLPSAFLTGGGGAYVTTIRDAFGISVDTSSVASATVPAASSLVVHYSVPAPAPLTPTPTISSRSEATP